MRNARLPRSRCAALPALCAAAGAASFCIAPAAAQTFTPLGPSPLASATRASAISADGLTAVGDADTPAGQRAFRWTAATGLVELPMLPAWTSASALAVSADGSIIVGRGGTPSEPRAALWSTRPGMPPVQDLGMFPGDTEATAAAVSADGSVIAGWTSSAGFRWTEPGGMESLTFLIPLALSADGHTAGGLHRRVGGILDKRRRPYNALRARAGPPPGHLHHRDERRWRHRHRLHGKFRRSVGRPPLGYRPHHQSIHLAMNR